MTDLSDETPQAQDIVDEDLSPLVPGQTEGEDDAVSRTGPPDSFKASIASRDWTVETLVAQMRKDRINLSPAFQRRNAWLGNRKSKLIESILIGYPIPQIVLAENKDRPGTYFVLDGKQRLLALRQFFVEEDNPRDAGFERLRLEQLEVLSELNRKTVVELEADKPTLFATLENYTIRTVVLSEWNSEDLLLSLFLRLNTGSLTLSPQELRQALIPGDFIQWLDKSSGELLPLLLLLGNKHPDRRMVDTELMLRFLAFDRSASNYRGNLKQFLDDTCRTMNATWSAAQQQAEASVFQLGAALDAATSIFGSSGTCRKWSGNRFERAINRAVFDVQMFSLSRPEVRELALAKPDTVKAAFKSLCDRSAEFATAITSTTKTKDAFLSRHRLWRDALAEVLGGVRYSLPVPLTRP